MAHNITSSVAGAPGTGYFVIDGNYSTLFVPGSSGVIQPTVFTIAGSAGNDGQYTVLSSSHDVPTNKTRINVTTAVLYSTVSSGVITIVHTPSYKIDFSDPAAKPSIFISPQTINGPMTFVEGTTDTPQLPSILPSTSLDLPGRGTSNYGELLLQNIVRMTEHFSSDIEPTAPTTGQLWYDTTTDTLKLRTLDALSVPIWTPVLSGSLTINGYTHEVPLITPQATWNVQHNLASRNVQVQTYADNGTSFNMIMPYSVEIVDLNNVTISFTAPTAGKAVIIGSIDSQSIPTPASGALTAGNGLEINNSVLSVKASGNFNLSSGTLDLTVVPGLIPGTYNSYVVNSYGRVVGASNVDYAAGNYLPLTGGFLSGILNGTSIRASQGLPNSSDNSTVGFSFGADGDTGLFSNGTTYSNTTQISMYFNNSPAFTFNNTGIFDLNTGYIQKTTGNGTARWMQQDGSGRQHWYWNTAGGMTPVFEVAGEDVTDIMHTANAGNPYIAFRAASGIGKNAGDAVSWQDIVYADLLGTFTYKGSSVWHSTNLTNVSQLNNNMNYVQSTSVPTFSGGIGGVEGGEIHLAKSTTSILSGDVVIDVHTDKLRIYEGGGTTRGAFIDLLACTSGASTNLLTPSWNAVTNKPTTLTAYGVLSTDSVLSTNYYPQTGGTLTGNITVNHLSPAIHLRESDVNTNWRMVADGGTLRFDKDTALGDFAGTYVTLLTMTSSNITLSAPTSFVGDMTVNGNINLAATKTIYNSNWFRSTGTTGWYSETYGGGINMSDTTYIRTFGGKHLYVNASATNVPAIVGITGAAVANHAVSGQPGNTGAYGGVIGFTQDSTKYGILGFNNTYAFYGQGPIYASGDITGLSDERMKTDINTVDNALDIVNAIRGVRFKWKDSGELSLGVIAQEVQAVLPEIVHENMDGQLSVAYGNLSGVLIQAVKELSSKLDAALARIAELEKR